MKLIKPKAKYIPQQEGLTGVFKQIELCGRTCYKSEDKITENSAESFVQRMINSNHTAMLEHGTIYLNIPADVDRIWPYLSNPVWVKCYLIDDEWWAVTTNYRFIIENELLNDLEYLCEPTEDHEKRYTFKFITDRGVSHELVRHRVFSFAQESSRYCNYSKDKFGNELTFIKPSWFKESQISVSSEVAQSSNINGAVFYERPYKAYWINTDAQGYDWYKEDFFIYSCQIAESCYLHMLEEGATPQEARQVLPNAIKTEICMTGFESDLKYFFDLRYYGTTGAPHPDMKKLAGLALEEAKSNKILNYEKEG